MQEVIRIRHFLSGDETGTLYTKDFTNEEKAHEWRTEMGRSAEFFSEESAYVSDDEFIELVRSENCTCYDEESEFYQDHGCCQACHLI